MPTFYDYDMIVAGGAERYVLRANMKPMPIGACVVVPAESGRGWTRKTRWRSRHGTRYEWFSDLDAALTSGIKWARRRERTVH